MPNQDEMITAWIDENASRISDEMIGESEPSQELWERMLTEIELRARRSVAEEMVGREDFDFIRRRPASELEFWVVVELLPRLTRVDMLDFHETVREFRPAEEMTEGGDARAGTLRDEMVTNEGGINANENDDDDDSLGPSFLTTVTLLRTSQMFRDSLRRHWRFSKANFTSLSLPPSN